MKKENFILQCKYKMIRTYCGNNINFPGLVAGTHVSGTNYQCLRRGIGVGYHLPYDAAYAQPHMPIDQRRFYCGNAPVPPPAGGYFAVGSASKCMQIGVGVGKARKAGQGPPWGMNFIRYYLPFLLFFSVVGSILAVGIVVKPKFISKIDKETNKMVIDWSKFIPYFSLFVVLVALLIWIIWKRFVRRWV